MFTAPPAVIQLTIEIEKGKETLASAVLVHREDGPRGVVLFFLTSETLLPAKSVATPGWESEGEGASRQDASTLSIAVIRILIEKSSLVPAAMVLEPPREGEPIFVVTYNAAGQPVVVPQHARRVSARSAMGDIDISSAVGCVGAPVFTESGVFGIVTECGTGQPPLITLLSAGARHAAPAHSGARSWTARISNHRARQLIDTALAQRLGHDCLRASATLDKSPRVAEIRHLETARGSGWLDFQALC